MNLSNAGTCPFCAASDDRVVFASERSIAIWDGFPVTEGHLLIVPRRHVPVWTALNAEEVEDIVRSVGKAQQLLLERYSIDGFNVGFNEGAAGGQTVPHFHVHVIPRRLGDMTDPRGGVRHVIPEKGNYVRSASEQRPSIGEIPHGRALIAGGDDALIEHLLPHIRQAHSIDVTVAFVLESGARLLQPHFQELLDRGGRLRILAGDYLDVTDPSALRRLLDLNGDVHRWMFETMNTSFHPKSWIFYFASGGGLAIVGSSNLSEVALRTGVEWNYRVYGSSTSGGWQDVRSGFENLIKRIEIRALTNEWIDRYEARRIPPTPRRQELSEVADERPPSVPFPHEIQQRALRALSDTRSKGYTAGLVVLATGLGKTWLAAFDSDKFKRILFVAHREEILTQAIETFRRLRPTGRFGRYTGDEKDLTADVLFASIQTLGRTIHLKKFAADAFDYIVVDEFHHASARTYRTLIEHFTPQFLLGLTATPERTDGGDLLGLCQENLVFRCDVFEGIERELLSPFRYFGVPDEVDYAQIPWRSSSFDEVELTAALATQARAQNALEQLQQRGGQRAIGFCCSRLHADFMAQFFNDKGIAAVAVHSGQTSAPRIASLERLQAGDLRIVFAVDILNEGVDLPEIDTVLMLRPTESSIVWMQQFGRGLRLSEHKSHLVVLDYIGNHRSFLTKVRALLNVGEGDRSLALMLEAIRKNEASLPPGCEVTYDLKALDILEGLLRATRDADALEAFYVDFRLRHGQRPTALEIFHAGFNPRASGHGSWFAFVDHMGDLGTSEDRVYRRHGSFLDSVAITPMSKSYKMLVLEALLAEGALPGATDIETLTSAFIRIAERNPHYRMDVSVPLENVAKVRELLIANPIQAWIDGKGTGGEVYFALSDRSFGTTFEVQPEMRETFVDMLEELVAWRLGQYLRRAITQEGDEPAGGDASGLPGSSLELWRDYARPDIARQFGVTFSPGNWNSGIVSVGQNLVLLVTLEKGNLSAGNDYIDHFIDSTTFQWHSQNQTSKTSRRGQIISGSLPGFQIHLFVRTSKLRGTTAAPFTYCGAVTFQSWDGEKPITVIWKLPRAVPNHLHRLFDIEQMS